MISVENKGLDESWFQNFWNRLFVADRAVVTSLVPVNTQRKNAKQKEPRKQAQNQVIWERPLLMSYTFELILAFVERKREY